VSAESSQRAEDAPPPVAGPLARVAYGLVFALALLTAAVVVVYFFIGLADGSISAFNIGLWSALLVFIGAVLWGGRALRARGRTGAALVVLGLLALPGVAYGLFVLLIVVTQPHWN